MKLINKTLLYYLIISLPLLLIAGIMGYYFISKELSEGMEEALWKEKAHIERALDVNSDPKNLNVNGLTIISEASEGSNGFFYSDRVVYDSLKQEDIRYRVLTSYYKHRDQNYEIEIARPTMEEEELKEGLLFAFTMILAFLIVSFFLVSWILSKTLWKPFYRTLKNITAYDIKHQQLFGTEPTSTKEFAQLNAVLLGMTNKLRNDFTQQKEFTENAAHEIQTPLSVIRANISLLLQSSNLTAEEMNQLVAIDNSTKKLASLHKALLLLAKIENNQFKETTTINLNKFVLKECEHVSDLLASKEIGLDNKMVDVLTVSMNPLLVDVLLGNLFQNAIRHNVNGGKITLETTTDSFSISNTGDVLKINSHELFIRFKKTEASRDSVGLGLAIVKSICTLYSIEITYDDREGLHQFKLKFLSPR